MDISVVVPVYKAKDCIHELCRRIVESIEKATINFEIILVEDGGSDGSWQVIQQLAKQDPRIKGIKFSRNFGQHYGITAGLDYAQGDWTVVMDCDLQDPPESIINLYHHAISTGSDVVIARRKQRQHGLLKTLCSKGFYRVFEYLSGRKYNRSVGNFCIISKQVVSVFCQVREHLRFFGAILDWAGFDVAYIDVPHDARFAGKGSYSLHKLLTLALNGIIAYSDKPLRLSIKLGFTISGIAFLYGIYIFIRALFTDIEVPGWSTLIISLYFLGGIIIANLGIIGIYLGKTFEETKKRPLYIIKERTFETD